MEAVKEGYTDVPPGKLAAAAILKDRERGRLRGVKVGASAGNGAGRTAAASAARS